MDISDNFEIEHLYLTERTCRVCGQTKDLIDGFYRTRKDRGPVASSYSYECKDCTIKRVVTGRMVSNILDKWEYPDW